MVAEEDALHAEVAEKDQGVAAGPEGAVEIALPFVTMVLQEGVKLGRDPVVLLLDPGGAEDLRLMPPAGKVKAGLSCPVLGEPVPADALLLRPVGAADGGAELPKPGAFQGLPPHPLQGGGGGVLGTAQGGDVIGGGLDGGKALREEFRLLAAHLRQRVDGIVRVAVADDEEFHLTPLSPSGP